MNISDVQKEWNLLDKLKFVNSEKQIKLLSHVRIDGIFTEGLPPVREIKIELNRKLLSLCPKIKGLILALKILLFADRNSVIIANGSDPTGNFICLLNYYIFFGKRKILFWDSHLDLQSSNSIKRYFYRKTFLGCQLATVWSRKQIENYSKNFSLPKELFIFIPYKANHSQWPERKQARMDFVFSGGNTKRDYKTLVNAVRNTDITLIISTTDRELLKTIQDIPNVIALAASEPSYAKLMAASRMVIMPMSSKGIKGAGEANFCNAMWHGKPLIASDSISAENYIIENETGYIVPTGDVKKLRKRIIELWEDDEKCKRMGDKGRETVLKYYTHDKVMRRIVCLACLLAKEKKIFTNKPKSSYF